MSPFVRLTHVGQGFPPQKLYPCNCPGSTSANVGRIYNIRTAKTMKNIEIVLTLPKSPLLMKTPKRIIQKPAYKGFVKCFYPLIF